MKENASKSKILLHEKTRRQTENNRRIAEKVLKESSQVVSDIRKQLKLEQSQG